MLIEALKKLHALMGKFGFICFLASMVGAMGLAFVDYSIAFYIQLFLFKLKLTEKLLIPETLGFLRDISTTVLVAGLIGIGLFRSLFTLMSEQLNLISNQTLRKRLKLILYHEMIFNKSKTYDASEANHYIADLFEKTGLFALHGGKFFITLTQITFLLIAMSGIAWKETLIGLIGVFLVGMVSMTLNKQVRYLSQYVSIKDLVIMQYMERIARNKLFIRISRSEQEELEKISSLTRENAAKVISYFLNNGLATNIPYFLGISLLAAIVFISQGYFLTDAKLLLAFLYLFLRFVLQLSVAFSTFSWTNAYRHQFDKVWGFYNSALIESRTYPDHDSQKKSVKAYSKELSTFGEIPEIDFRNVGFSYQQDGKPILKNFNLKIPSGAIAGIHGPSGAGKSTLINLLTGQLSPDSGIVMINNLEANKYFEKSNVPVGYVGPDPFTIKGTIKDNLTYGVKRNVSDLELIEALDLAFLKEEISSLPGGLNYELSEVGEGLSAGQKQRLALARAFVNKPKLLILDEASANLDMKSEEQIAQSVEKLKGMCTVFIVSHRERLLKNADLKIELRPLEG